MKLLSLHIVAIAVVLSCMLGSVSPTHALTLAQAAPAANTAPSSPTIPDPLHLGEQPIPELVSRIVKAFLGIIGIIALVLFLYGGFLWLTAAGNSSKIEEGRNIFVWAVLGLVVIFSSYAIVNFVFDRLLQLSQ